MKYIWRFCLLLLEYKYFGIFLRFFPVSNLFRELKPIYQRVMTLYCTRKIMHFERLIMLEKFCHSIDSLHFKTMANSNSTIANRSTNFHQKFHEIAYYFYSLLFFFATHFFNRCAIAI